MPARRGRRVNREGWMMVNKLQDTEGRAQILGKYGGDQLLLFIYIFTQPVSWPVESLGRDVVCVCLSV